MSEGLPAFVPPSQIKDNTIPRFYMKPMHNKFRSEQEGRPIYDEVEYVEIIIPGDRNAIVDERVKDDHRQRWPQFYDAFKKGQEMAVEGTPLEFWPGVVRSMVEELKHFNIRTVEALAGIDDQRMQKAIPMGGHALRDKARRYLEEAAGAAPMDALNAENTRLRGTIETMQDTMSAMQAEIAKLKEGAKA